MVVAKNSTHTILTEAFRLSIYTLVLKPNTGWHQGYSLTETKGVLDFNVTTGTPHSISIMVKSKCYYHHSRCAPWSPLNQEATL